MPYIVRLVQDAEMEPGATLELPPRHASVLTIALRVKTSGPVILTVDERKNEGWEEKNREEFLEGVTLWECRLSRPDFRVRLYNPSPVDGITVTVDANIPQLTEASES
ncbi:MAG: hypothetical protein ACUVRC_07485 [Desulfotomaculales bacterium]